MKTGFSLRKVKLEKKLVTIDYQMDGEDMEIQKRIKHAPHPDFKEALNALRPLAVEFFEMPDGNDVQFEVRGITISEKKGVEQVLVSTVFSNSHGARVAMNTGNINVEGDTYDNQKGLDDIVKKVVDECNAYLFDDKRAQLSIPDGEEEEDPAEEPELPLD